MLDCPFWKIAEESTLQHTCNTLQHTASRCIALQHTATRYNTCAEILEWTITEKSPPQPCTLQHTATHRNTLQQHSATPALSILIGQSQEKPQCTHCNTRRHTAVHCNTRQHTATHCNTLQHTATFYNTHVQFIALQHIATPVLRLQNGQSQKTGGTWADALRQSIPVRRIMYMSITYVHVYTHLLFCNIYIHIYTYIHICTYS